MTPRSVSWGSVRICATAHGTAIDSNASKAAMNFIAVARTPAWSMEYGGESVIRTRDLRIMIPSL
jgi:hypothetical protein